MKRLLGLILVLALALPAVLADVYIKQNTHTDAVTMMGQKQPAKDEIQELWVGDKRFAMHSSQMSMIVDANKKILNFIDHKQKYYIEMTLPLQLEAYMPEGMAKMMEAMMGKISIAVTPMNQKKKIENWPCTGYKVNLKMAMMDMEQTVWATTDVPFDYKELNNMLLNNLYKFQLRVSDDIIKEMDKIKGYPVLSETVSTIQMVEKPMTMRTKVLEISKKAPAAKAYAIPQGYAKKDKISMGGGH